VEDFLGEGRDRGCAVAEAWRETHSCGAALKSGRESETGALSTTLRRYFIVCGE
jgi:hypothetical protein